MGESDDRDLGGLGESTLSTWCNQVGITANPAIKDKKGWDFILQFAPSKISASIKIDSADLAPPELSCFVQVKATDGDRGLVPVALSNWKRLVDNPLPAFFLILEFEGQDVPQKAFLVEVDGEWTSKALKSLREVPEGELDQTHKKTLSVNWDDRDALGGLSGKDLASKIREKIGTDFAKYVTDKMSRNKKLGYEERPYGVSVVFRHEDTAENYRRLVDFSLGEISELEIASFRTTETRFGIEKPTLPTSEEGGKLSLGSTPFVAVNVTLRDDESRRVVTFPGKAYVPGLLFPFIPREYWRLRIETDHAKFESSLDKEGGTFSFSSGDAEQRRTIDEWLKIATLLEIMLEGKSRGFKIDVNFPTGSIQFSEVGSFDLRGSEFLANLLSCLVALRFVANHVGLDRSLTISVAELLNQRGPLEILRTALDSGPLDIEIRVMQPDIGDYKSGSIALIKVPGVRFDKTAVFGVVSLIGEGSKTWCEPEKVWELAMRPEKRRLHSYCMLDDGQLKSYSFKSKIDACVAELGDGVELTLLPQEVS